MNTVRNQFVKYTFLCTESLADWREYPDLLSCKFSECGGSLFLRIQRTPLKKITLAPQDYADITEAVNKLQNVFRVGTGHVSYGSPEGGTLQFSYETL